MRGGEKVVEALCELFPDADLYTHVYDPDAVSETIRRHRVRTTFIQRLPRARRWYQRYLPLMPMALEGLDLRGYDLVISSESGPAKGVIPPPGAAHVCYCHTPMRYLWDMYPEYREQAGPITRALMRPLTHYLRIWDVTSAARVDHWIANSRHVAARIRKYYRRDAEVIPPPVDTSAFEPAEGGDDYYLFVGQLVRYKRADLAVEAFNRLDRRLVVIGTGEEMRDLKRKAGPGVHLLGWQDDAALRGYYARCRALIFPGIEDFGIVPVEAMASGRPVIAYREGGALDIVREGETGLFFDELTPEAVTDAVERFERMEGRFDPAALVRHARQYDRARFKERVERAIEQALEAARGPA